MRPSRLPVAALCGVAVRTIGAGCSGCCDCLGLVEMEKPDLLKDRGGLWLRAGDRELHLGVQEPFNAAKKAYPAFRVADVRQVAAQLADHGFDVNWDDNIPGVTRFETFDVFGNRLEFLQQEP
jgi:hypothetical protein